jgi:hypothetical protein
MSGLIRQGLIASLDTGLVDELLAAYQEAKRNFYLGGLRLSAVEGGRFCEAAFRILQQRTKGSFDPVGKQVDTDSLIKSLANIPARQQPDSIRLHMPRALRVVYDIRSKRDNAHLGDGIDPNLQDASLVVGVLDWVLAEFVRLYHAVPPNVARNMVDGIVTRIAPAIEDFDGFLKVLRTDLGASDFVVLLLYQKGRHGATFTELWNWVRPTMRVNLRRTLNSLKDDKAYVHECNDTFWITRSGQHYVETKHLMDVQETV